MSEASRYVHPGPYWRSYDTKFKKPLIYAPLPIADGGA